MFGKSELQTRGRIMIAVEHPRTSRVYEFDFYVAAKHEQPFLGFKLYRLLELLHVVDENICEVRAMRKLKRALRKQKYLENTLTYSMDSDIDRATVDPSVLPVEMLLLSW